MNAFLTDLCIWQSTRHLIQADRWRRWGRVFNHADQLTYARMLFAAHARESATQIAKGRRP